VRVSLSLRAARAFNDGCATALDSAELRTAIAKAQRASTTKRKLRQPKAERKAAKAEETSAIRDAVMARSRGRCECGCGQVLGQFGDGQLDHFWGRAKAPQSTQNCWMLAETCHRLKTLNKPSAESWLRDFIRHCERHSLLAEVVKARARLAFVLARKGEAP